MHLHHVARILRHHRSVALLGNLVKQTRLGLLHARLLLDLLQPCLRSLGVLGRTLHHEVVLQILVHGILGHLRLAVAHVLHGLTDPYELNGHAALADVVTDVVTERIRNLGTLLLALEHGGIGCGILDLGRVAAGQTDAVLLGTLGCDLLRTLAALAHEILTQHVERLVVLLRGLTHGALLDTFVDGLEIKGNVPHLVIHAVADIGAQRIRKRVEIRKAAHTNAAVLAAAGSHERSTCKCRCKKNFFHCFVFQICLIVCAC